MCPDPRATQHPLRPGASGERGFTLIELLVGLSIGILVAIAVYDLMDWSSRAYQSGNDLATAQSGGRGVLEIMGSDIRHAGLSPFGAAFLAVPAGDATKVRLLSDLNGNTIVSGPTEPNETVSYQFVGPAADGTWTLERGIDFNGDWLFTGAGEGVDTIATRVVAIDADSNGTSEPFFSYQNAPPATSRITVTFGIRSQFRDVRKKAHDVVNFQDSVALRNPK